MPSLPPRLRESLDPPIAEFKSLKAERQRRIPVLTSPYRSLRVGGGNGLVHIHVPNGVHRQSRGARRRRPADRCIDVDIAVDLAGEEELAAAVKCFQFRDLRAKAGTDKADATDMREAQQQLGHKSVKTTEIYLRTRAGEKVTPTK